MTTFRYNQSVGPTSEPVTLAEAKLHLRIDHSEEDSYVSGLITTARLLAEKITRRQLMTATWVARGDGFPTLGEPIYLQNPPLQSVTSVAYTDANGAAQTWPAAEYSVDIYDVRGSIRPAYGYSYPATYSSINVVTVTYVAGYSSAANVPPPIKQAMLLMVGWWYEQRESVNIGNVVNEVPLAARHLLGPWSAMEFS